MTPAPIAQATALVGVLANYKHEPRWRSASLIFLSGRVVFGLNVLTYCLHLIFFAIHSLPSSKPARLKEHTAWPVDDDEDSHEFPNTYPEFCRRPVYGHPHALLFFTALNKLLQNTVFLLWSSGEFVKSDPERSVLMTIMFLLAVMITQRIYTAAYILYKGHNQNSKRYQVNLLLPFLGQFLLDYHVIAESRSMPRRKLAVTPMIIELLKSYVVTVNFVNFFMLFIGLMFFVTPSTIVSSFVPRYGGLYEFGYKTQPRVSLLVIAWCSTLIQHLVFYSRVDANFGRFPTDQDENTTQTIRTMRDSAEIITSAEKSNKSVRPASRFKPSPASESLANLHQAGSLHSHLNIPGTKPYEAVPFLPEEEHWDNSATLEFSLDLATYDWWTCLVMVFRLLEVLGRASELAFAYAYGRFILADLYSIMVLCAVFILWKLVFVGIEDRVRQSWSSKNVFVFGRSRFYWALSGYIVADFYVGRHQLLIVLVFKIVTSGVWWIWMFMPGAFMSQPRPFFTPHAHVVQLWPFVEYGVFISIACTVASWVIFVVVMMHPHIFQRYNLFEARKNLSFIKAHVIFKYFASVHPHSIMYSIKSDENSTLRLLPYCARIHPRFFKYLVHTFSLPLHQVDFSGLAFADRKDKHFDFAYMDFSNAIFNGTTFIGCDLRGCNFRECEIREASFFHDELSESNFQDAILHGSIFHKCVTRKVEIDPTAVKHEIKLDPTLKKPESVELDRIESVFVNHTPGPESSSRRQDFLFRKTTFDYSGIHSSMRSGDGWGLPTVSVTHEKWEKMNENIDHRRLNQTEYASFWKILTRRDPFGDVEKGVLTSSIALLSFSTRKPPHLVFRVVGSLIRAANQDLFDSVKILPKLLEWVIVIVALVASIYFLVVQHLQSFQQGLVFVMFIPTFSLLAILGDYWTPTSLYFGFLISFSISALFAWRFTVPKVFIIPNGWVQFILPWAAWWVVWYLLPVNTFRSFSGSMYHAQRYREQVEKTVMLEEELMRFFQLVLFQGHNRRWKRHLDVNPWSFERFQVEPWSKPKLDVLVAKIQQKLHDSGTKVVPEEAASGASDSPYMILSANFKKSGNPIEQLKAEALEQLIREFVQFAHEDLELVFKMKDNLQKILGFSWNLVEVLFQVIFIFVLLIFFIQDKNAAINSIIPAMLTSFALGKNSFDSISKGISFVYFSHPFTAGDVVVYKTNTYEVESIELATTTLRNTATGLYSIVSNSDLESQLINNITITQSITHTAEVYVKKRHFYREKLPFLLVKSHLEKIFDVKECPELPDGNGCELTRAFFLHITRRTFPWNSFVKNVGFNIDFKPKSRPQGKAVEDGGKHIRLAVKITGSMPHYKQPKRTRREIEITKLLVTLTNAVLQFLRAARSTENDNQDGDDDESESEEESESDDEDDSENFAEDEAHRDAIDDY